jgi:hypothetical protein
VEGQCQRRRADLLSEVMILEARADDEDSRGTEASVAGVCLPDPSLRSAGRGRLVQSAFLG